MGPPTITIRDIELAKTQGSVEAMAQMEIEYFFLATEGFGIREICGLENLECVTLELA